MHRTSCWLVFSAFMAGCATSGPDIAIDDLGVALTAELAKMDGNSAVDQLRKMPRRAGVLPAAERRGEFADEIDSLQWVSTGRPESIRQVVKKTPPGSYVQMSSPLLNKYQGTLLRTDGDKVALVNCVCREAVKGFDGDMVARTTFAPFVEVDMAALSNMKVVAVPHESDPLTNQDEVVHEIVFVSGRRRRVEVPRLPRWLSGQASEAEMTMARREHGPHSLLTTTPGSQITVRNEAGRWYEGSFLSADDMTVKLQDCICVESCRNASDDPISNVSYTYSQGVQTASVIEVVVVGQPSAEFSRSDEDCDGCDFSVESFAFHSGSRRPLKVTLKKHDPEELAKLGGSKFNPIRPFGSVSE